MGASALTLGWKRHGGSLCQMPYTLPTPILGSLYKHLAGQAAANLGTLISRLIRMPYFEC